MDNDTRSMLDSYRWNHHECVYCSLVPKSEYPHCNGQFFTVEHVWQRLGERIHDPVNLVVCCEESHRWKHKFSILGRIAALAWKLRNGEFDRQKLFDLVGMDPIGWISNRREDGHLPEWCDTLALELIKAHGE